MQGKWEGKREDALFSKFPAKLVGFSDRLFGRENFFGFFSKNPVKPIDKGVKCKYNAYKPT